MSLATDPFIPTGLRPRHLRERAEAAPPAPVVAPSFEELMQAGRGVDRLTPDLRRRLRAADPRRGGLLALAGLLIA